MQVGDPFGEGWSIYRRFWRHLVPIAFGTYLIVAAISLALTIVLGVFGSLLGAVVAFVGVFLLQAALVEAVADVRDGRVDFTFRETLGRAWARLGVAVAAGTLAGLGILLGLILVIVPGLYLATIWCLVIPVVVLEGVPVMQSFGRSRSLVAGSGFTVFGVLVLLVVIEVVVATVVAIVFKSLSYDTRSFISNLVSNTFVAPFGAAVLTSMYFRLRDQAAPAPVPAGAA